MYQLGLASNMQILTWPARKGLGGWVNSQHHQRKCCAGLIFLAGVSGGIYIYICTCYTTRRLKSPVLVQESSGYTSFHIHTQEFHLISIV